MYGFFSSKISKCSVRNFNRPGKKRNSPETFLLLSSLPNFCCMFSLKYNCEFSKKHVRKLHFSDRAFESASCVYQDWLHLVIFVSYNYDAASSLLMSLLHAKRLVWPLLQLLVKPLLERRSIFPLGYFHDSLKNNFLVAARHGWSLVSFLAPANAKQLSFSDLTKTGLETAGLRFGCMLLLFIVFLELKLFT